MTNEKTENTKPHIIEAFFIGKTETAFIGKNPLNWGGWYLHEPQNDKTILEKGRTCYDILESLYSKPKVH